MNFFLVCNPCRCICISISIAIVETASSSSTYDKLPKRSFNLPLAQKQQQQRQQQQREMLQFMQRNACSDRRDQCNWQPVASPSPSLHTSLQSHCHFTRPLRALRYCRSPQYRQITPRLHSLAFGYFLCCRKQFSMYFLNVAHKLLRAVRFARFSSIFQCMHLLQLQQQQQQ